MAPVRTRLRPDGGLVVRMAATLLALAALYAAAGFVLIYVGAQAVLVVGIVAVVALVQFLLSSRLALAAAGARVVSPQEAPELHAIVDRLCFQSDMPKPRVAVADNSRPTPSPSGDRGSVAGIPDDDLRAVATMNAFFIVPTSFKRGVLGLFSTHPPLRRGSSGWSRWRRRCRAGESGASAGQVSPSGASEPSHEAGPPVARDGEPTGG